MSPHVHRSCGIQCVFVCVAVEWMSIPIHGLHAGHANTIERPNIINLLTRRTTQSEEIGKNAALIDLFVRSFACTVATRPPYDVASGTLRIRIALCASIFLNAKNAFLYGRINEHRANEVAMEPSRGERSFLIVWRFGSVECKTTGRYIKFIKVQMWTTRRIILKQIFKIVCHL